MGVFFLNGSVDQIRVQLIRSFAEAYYCLNINHESNGLLKAQGQYMVACLYVHSQAFECTCAFVCIIVYVSVRPLFEVIEQPLHSCQLVIVYYV